jgi:hypothetical protein
MVIVWCLLAAMNGYYAIRNYPHPMCFMSAAFCLWMLYYVAQDLTKRFHNSEE